MADGATRVRTIIELSAFQQEYIPTAMLRIVSMT